MSALRYLPPNALTALGLVCGLASLLAAHEGRWAASGYFIIWGVLLDNLDGPVARLLRATSRFGAQLDSFSDFINFGVAPAALIYLSLGGAEGLGFASGPGAVALALSCLAWVLAAMFRLARFNTSPGVPGILFGLPTTLAAGALVILYLALLKYAPAEGPLSPGGFFGEAHLVPRGSAPLVAWRAFPPLMLAGAALMASNLPMLRLGAVRNRVAVGLLGVGMIAGYICNGLRVFPELMIVLPWGWMLSFMAWGLLSPEARRHKPAPLFGDVPPDT